MIKLGAHQSTAGGLHEALNRVSLIGGNCLQIFSSSPRGWNFAKTDEERVLKFIDLKSRLKIDPIYFHASYLINLADNSKTGHLSKLSLIAEMNIAPKLGIKGSIIHLGSFKEDKSNNYLLYDRDRDKKFKILTNNIREILSKTPKKSLFIIENAGNRKIGQMLEEISEIVSDVDDSRVRLCLDTCHLFSNGYGFKNEDELNVFIDKLDELELLEKLEVWHINDSRDPLSSGRDRHVNIGKGMIGIDEFKTLLNHPKTKGFPFIIETPGFDGNGPDKKNIDILKAL